MSYESHEIESYEIKGIKQLPSVLTKSGETFAKVQLTDGYTQLNLIEWDATRSKVEMKDLAPGMRLEGVTWTPYGNDGSIKDLKAVRSVIYPPEGAATSSGHQENPVKGPVGVPRDHAIKGTYEEGRERLPNYGYDPPKGKPANPFSECLSMMEECVAHSFDIGMIAIKKLQESGLGSELWDEDGNLTEKGQEIILPAYIEKSFAVAISLSIEQFRRR